jgi:hypothetical protein
MKVIVARSSARFDNVWAQPYIAEEFAFDQQIYDLRKKYPPDGVNGDEFAEIYKKQTPEERAEEFATDMIVKEGAHQLESVVITEIDDDKYQEYEVKFLSHQTGCVETATVDNLYDIVQGLNHDDVKNNIVYERFEIMEDHVLTVSVDKKIVYDNTETVKQDVLKELGFDNETQEAKA